MKVPDASPVPTGSWRLSWQELAERTDVTRERLERLVELGILTPTDANQPFRSGDIHRVRAVAALERSGVAPEQIAAAMAAGELSFGYLDYVMPPPPVVDRTYSQVAEELGINAGPLVYENGDFYGRTVNIAARIAAYAEEGRVLVSDDVVSHGASDDIGFRRVGPVSFKGVSREVVVDEAERA